MGPSAWERLETVVNAMAKDSPGMGKVPPVLDSIVEVVQSMSEAEAAALERILLEVEGSRRDLVTDRKERRESDSRSAGGFPCETRGQRRAQTVLRAPCMCRGS